MSDPGKSSDLSPPSDSNEKTKDPKNPEIFSRFDVVSLFEQSNKSTASMSDGSGNSQDTEKNEAGDSELINLSDLAAPVEPALKLDITPVDLGRFLVPSDRVKEGQKIDLDFIDSLEVDPKLVELLTNGGSGDIRPVTAFGTDWTEDSISLSRAPVFGFAGSEPVAVGGEGLVVMDGRVKEPGEAPYISQKKLSLSDGEYTRDGEGRVVRTVGPNGRDERTYSFSSTDESDKPSEVTIGDTTYVRMGPITSGGKPVQRDGYDMHNWKMQDARGNLKGNWYGDMRISKEGVFSQYFNDTNKIRHEGADGKEISQEEADRRNRDGVWPSKVSVTRPDGSRIRASKTGNVVDSFEETVSVDGNEYARTWTKNGDVWTSPQANGKKMIGLELDGDGTLRYRDEEGRKIEDRPDATKRVDDGGTIYEYDRYRRLDSIEGKDLKRDYEYSTGNDGKSSLVAVESQAGEYQSRWRKDTATGKWKDLESGKSADKLRVLEDGSLEYVDPDGVKHVEAVSLKDIEYDPFNRPARIGFPGGATRNLTYDETGLKSISDRIPVKATGEVHESTWERQGSTDTFVSERENGAKFERTNLEATEFGDLKYRSQDGHDHVSRADDLDKISRGEFVLGSESLMEARDRLLETAEKNGIDMERFETWVKEFEKRAGDNKLDSGKVVRSMNNLSELLTEPTTGGPYSLDQRITIFDTAMHNLARPLEIDQGSHPTCNVTSVEVYAAVRHPDAYTGLIRDVALTGQWKALTGKVATPPEEALKPGKDEKVYDLDTPDSGKRSLASQAFQMTLINAMYETGEMDSDTEDLSDVRYIMQPSKQVTRREGGYVVTIDLGEDTLAKNGKPLTKNGKPINGPEMIQEDVLRSCEILFGERPPFIENAGYADIPGRGRQYSSDLISKERLFELKENNSFPILTPTMGGMHAQTIHDVWQNPKTNDVWVLLDNQHGEPEVKGRDRQSGEGDGDGWIKLETLHKTLRMSGEGRGYGLPVMPQINKYDHPSSSRSVR